MATFDIDPDIRRAHTLASDFYTNAAYFEESKEKIFARSWQLIGDVREFDSGENLLPKTILEWVLDEPVVLSKQADGEIFCLSNVCTHRGKILVEKSCAENGIRCRYHGRRFSLDGKFLSMPEFEEAKNFPSEADNLSRLPLEKWNRFLFATVDPVIDFKELVQQLSSRIGWIDVHKMEYSEELSKDYWINSHWALYCENYLEGFHIPFVHPALNKEINYDSYTTETFRYSSLQIGIAEGNEGIFDLPKDSPDYGKKVAAYYFFLFPNLMLNFYPWGLSVNIVKPLNESHTQVSYLTYVADRSKLNSGAGADVNKTELEDQAVVESVQKGIRSRFYSRGRYSPKREQGTHHFHRLIAEFMNKE